MRSIQAIIAGSVFNLVIIFFLGFIYMFIAVAYNNLAVDFPFLHDITGLLRYVVGIPVFIASMFAGGYVTAYTANTYSNMKIWFHGLVVGLITVGSMIYPTLEYSSLTLTGFIMTVLALSASSTGAFYWLKSDKINESLSKNTDT